jgi:hypothetical protein
MECPQCQSQDVIRCAIAYEQGTTTSQSQGTSTGRGAYTESHVATGDVVSGGVTMNRDIRSTTTSQTAFARRCAPPTSTWKYALLATVVFAVVDFFLFALVVDGDLRPNSFVHLMYAGLAVSVLWLALTIFNWPKYRAQLARWRKTWVCVRCGHQFLPG